MFTESATGLIVCVFQASGSNGEEDWRSRKRKKARFAGEREVDLGSAAYISYNITSVHINQCWVRNSKTTNDLMGAASEEPTFTEVQSHRE